MFGFKCEPGLYKSFPSNSTVRTAEQTLCRGRLRIDSGSVEGKQASLAQQDQLESPGGGGGIPYEMDGDARCFA